MVTRLKRSCSASAVQVVADYRLAERTKWMLYAGVGPAGHVIADTMMPRACWLDYLLRLRRVSPRPFARTKRRASAVAEQATPSPSSLAAANALPPASSKLHHDLLYLLHLLVEPFESR